MVAAVDALAQSLPEPSRTVFKCMVAGKTVYTDEPCLAGQRVDVEPTRGLNKATGRESEGADVARERRREALAEGLRPLTGMDSKQFDIHAKRVQLSPEVRRECAQLDTEILIGESREHSADPRGRTEIQHALLVQRQQHERLKC